MNSVQFTFFYAKKNNNFQNNGKRVRNGFFLDRNVVLTPFTFETDFQAKRVDSSDWKEFQH